MQVIDAVLANPDDKTELSLVYANVSEADIILKDKIDALAAKHPKQFKVRRRDWAAAACAHKCCAMVVGHQRRLQVLRCCSEPGCPSSLAPALPTSAAGAYVCFCIVLPGCLLPLSCLPLRQVYYVTCG